MVLYSFDWFMVFGRASKLLSWNHFFPWLLKYHSFLALLFPVCLLLLRVVCWFLFIFPTLNVKMPNPRLYPQNPLFSIEGLFMILDASWSPRYLSGPDLFLKLQIFFFSNCVLSSLFGCLIGISNVIHSDSRSSFPSSPQTFYLHKWYLHFSTTQAKTLSVFLTSCLC